MYQIIIESVTILFLAFRAKLLLCSNVLFLSRLRPRYSAFHLCVTIAVLLTVGKAVSTHAQSTAVVHDFPPRDVQVMRTWLTSQTLRLRFESAPSFTNVLSPGKTATYILAGSSHSLPKARFIDGHFYRLRGKAIVGEIYGTPSGLDLPQALLRINSLGLFREYPVYSLTVSFSVSAQPLYPMASELWFADYLEFEVDLGPPFGSVVDATQRTTGAPKVCPSSLAQALLLNPDISGAYLVTSSSQSWSDVLSWASVLEPSADAGGLFKALFYKPGFYRITGAGLNVARQNMHFQTSVPLAPASHWKVYRKGQEVPAIESPFAPSEEIIVLVPEWDVDEEGPAVLWIDASARHNDTSSSLRIRPQSATGVAPAAPCTLAQCEAVFERFEDYQTRIRPTAEVTRWYWKSISPDTVETFSLSLPSSFRAERDVEVTIYSALAHPRQALPQVELLAQGDTLATASLSAVQGTTPVSYTH
ncbi:MAG: hypothetical protein N2Z21_02525, partial [Candidatus Sumerlaeaceae bacterium]|nr:hypothetical protein [Candidatus Sumerlaeaceae bacterium]